MLRETIHANIDTNVDRATAGLRERCLAAGLDQPATDLLVNQTADVLKALVDQGRRIASVGSQMKATRELSGDGYLIRLEFGQGIPEGLLQRLFKILKGA
jgi:hypothetical protein